MWGSMMVSDGLANEDWTLDNDVVCSSCIFRYVDYAWKTSVICSRECYRDSKYNTTRIGRL